MANITGSKRDELNLKNLDEFQLTKNALFTTHDSNNSLLGDSPTTTIPVYNLKFNPGNNNDQVISHFQFKGGFRQSQSCIISCGGAASDAAAVWGGVGIQSYDTYEDENRGLFLNKFGGNVYCGGTNLTSFISNVNSNNAGYITANSTNTLTNKSISYDQLTGVPVIEDGGLSEKNFTSSLKSKLDKLPDNFVEDLQPTTGSDGFVDSGNMLIYLKTQIIHVSISKIIIYVKKKFQNL